MVNSLAETSLPESHYDACVLNGWLDQQNDPNETLGAAFSLLKPRGVLYLIAPNGGSYRSLLRREMSSAIYSTTESLRQLLVAQGFVDFIDLTQPASWEAEIESARSSGSLRLNHRQLKALRAALEREDAGKLSNGRDEYLVCLARKPLTRYDPTVAASRDTGVRERLEGRLVAGPSSGDGRVFLVRAGVKHWVTSVGWLKSRNMSLSDVMQVSLSDLGCIIEGCSLSDCSGRPPRKPPAA
jgi:hypothetical protein